MTPNNIPSGSLYTDPAPAEQQPTQPSEPRPQTKPARQTGKAEAFASFVSSGFSPLLLPTYCTMIALWATRLSSVPEATRLTTAAVTLVLTCFLPLAALLSAIRMGKINDTRVRDRRQRVILYPVAIVAYLICALYMARVHAPAWLTAFFLGVSLSSIVAFAVNFRWKISAHASGCGCLLAFMFYIAYAGLSDLFFLPWISGAVIISGAVLSSRLILKAHDIYQVFAGLMNGLVCMTLIMMIFG